MIILVLAFLLWSKDKIIRRLTHEIGSNSESMARITELLRVLVYGKVKRGLDDDRKN